MAKKIKQYKVGCDSETYAISLVEEPAIEETLIALEKQNEVKVQLANEEKHMVYSAVLVPDKDIYRFDGENEYYINFTKDSIERMSQDFMKEYRQHEITLDHEDLANEVCVVESWIKTDMYRDKSVALGLNENLPIGTWFAGMKVNNIDVWDRVKSGELRGFSVESLISLEEFSKQNNNNMEIETNEMFWDKLKNILKETFSKKEEKAEETAEIEPINEELEAETPSANEAKADVEPTVETTVEPQTEPEPTPEPTVEEKPQEEPKNEPIEAPKAEEPKQDNHLEELLNSMREEIKALKEMNEGLNDKIKEMGKQPSTNPVNVNAKPNAGSSYSAWREQLRGML